MKVSDQVHHAAVGGYVAPVIATAVDKMIQVFKFSHNTPLRLFEHNTGTPVSALAASDDSIVYCADHSYYLLKFGDRSCVKLPPSPVSSTFAHEIAKNSFLLGYQDFMLLAGLGDEKGQMLKYDKSLGIPRRILPYEQVIYQFFDTQFTRVPVKQTEVSEPLIFNIPNVSAATMIGDNLLIVNPEAASLIGSMPRPAEIAQSIIDGRTTAFENLMSKLSRDIASETSFSVFVELWRSRAFETAINFISRHLVVGSIVSILSLFPIIQLQNEQPAQLALPPLTDVSAPILKTLAQFLRFTKSEYLKDSIGMAEIPAINTALAQCLAGTGQCRELDRLIKDGNLDLRSLVAFCTANTKTLPIGPGFAVLQGNTGDVEKAMTLWRELDDLCSTNPMFVTEASFTLQNLRDSSKLVNYLDWILKRDPNPPKTAINALLSVNHDPAVVSGWLKANNLTGYRMRYCTFIVTQENRARGRVVAHETLLHLLDILSDIDDKKFDVGRLDFTAASEELRGSKLRAEAKKEVTQLVFLLLEAHAESINGAEALEHARNVSNEVLLAIYRAKHQYNEALELITNEGDTFPIEEVQEFCRRAPDPPAAFSVVLRLIGADNLLAKYAAFVGENLQWLNLAELVSTIPSDTKVAALSELLKAAYSLLMQRKLSLASQIAMSESLLLDEKYTRANVQTLYCTIARGMTCPTCHQAIADDVQCLMAPGASDGLVYHVRCKPAFK
jgi:hypothetical protein